jgi:hypothetical protein
MNPDPVLHGFFDRVRKLLDARPRPVFVDAREAERYGAKVAYVQAEAADVGLFCQVVLRNESEYLEFTKAKT